MRQSEIHPTLDQKRASTAGRAWCALLSAALLWLASGSINLANAASTTALQTSILALDSARRTALQELDTSSFNETETADYRDFIVYLNTQIVNYCLELAEQVGPGALAELPCPTVVGAAAAPYPADALGTVQALPGPPPAEAQPQTEQTAAVEARLFAALAEFDDMLLKEEANIAARVPSQRESGATGRNDTAGSRAAASSGESSTAGGEEDVSSRQNGSGSADAMQREQHSAAENAASRQASVGVGKGAGDSKIDHAKFGAPRGKLPPPEDDDIVARQLREAAEKEPDPELQQKLWEEYWKYKGVKKGG